MDNTRPFIFYLTLEEQLPEQFYTFDRLFKEYDFILVPVRVDQLQQLVASTDQNHVMVISCTSNFREYRLFNEKVRKILKYVLKSKRLSFLQLSSFANLNDTRAHNLTKNYFFLKTPVAARELTEKMVSFHIEKSEKSQIWPGGHKSLAGVA